MSAAAAFRLPGVYFLPAQAPRPVDLPPLDVAGFVGFATRGPIGVATPVKDVSGFDAIFGGQFTVARDASGKPIYAYLRDAVSGFFTTGGARCYIARVAGGGAAPARFAVPGMISIDAFGSVGRAAISASSPGVWGDALSLGAIQTTTLLPPAAFTLNLDATLTWTTGGAPQAVQAGDVLRLTFANDVGRQWLFPVSAVGPVNPSGLEAPQAILTAQSVWPVTVTLPPAPPPIVAVWRLSLAGPTPLHISASFSTPASGIGLTLSGQPGTSVTPGDVLLIGLTDGSQQALTVADVQTTQAIGSLPAASVALSAPHMVGVLGPRGAQPAMPSGLGVTIQRVERLQMTLQVRYQDATPRELNALGFNAGHARFWGDIAVAESGAQAGGSLTSSGATQAQQSQILAPGDASVLYPQLFGDQRFDLDWSDPRLPTVASTLLAPAPTGLTYLPIGMALIGSDASLVGPDPSSFASDDIQNFSGELFLDANLTPSSNPAAAALAPATLLASANDLYFLRNQRLKGVYSLMFVDEVALIAAPDAVQTGWTKSPIGQPSPPLPAAVAVSPTSAAFATCPQAPTILAVAPTGGPTIGGTPVTISGAAFPSMTPPLVTFGGVAADDVVVLNSTALTCTSPRALAPGQAAVTVSNSAGASSLASGFLYWPVSTTPPLPLANPTGAADPNWLQLVHVALIGLCQARGDAVAILALPLNFEEQDCVDWLQSLRQNLGLPRHGQTLKYATNIADLSYAAVYHPWLLVSDPNGPAGTLRPTPPDGAMCGAIAASELATEAWIAPANAPLAGILDLEPAFSDDAWADLFALQFNVVRREAKDFRVMSAHTLADDKSLLQLSVRRLLIQLRKAVLQRGQDLVFAENNVRTWRRVQFAFEQLLGVMFNGGAFAGATRQSSFRVIVDDSVNTQTTIDQGQMIVLIQVAPSQPMEFITVLLTRTGQSQLQVAET
ncbi:IPT/TIG domain-containing protein [Rhodoblastus sp.]|uniref:IPT/TIG domain-containing protein n=1 Tax=Rhodoblastus sp. TaxID=1962975 RepID=UPI003F9CAEBD